MPTARSSTRAAETRRAIAEVRPLLQFRAATLRGKALAGARIGFGVIIGLSVAAAWFPAYADNPRFPPGEVLILLPTGYISVLVISIVSAAASGGGRELLNREHATAFPVSPTTDHLGALLMAPLNIAWLLQSWAMLGITAYAIGPRPTLLAAQLPVLICLVAATAIAQLLAWSVEWVRRGPHGRTLTRSGVAALGLTFAYLIVTDRLVPMLDNSPTLRITLGVLNGARGQWGPWLEVVLALTLIALVAIALGAVVNHAVARRPARDELRVESSARAPRPHPGSDLLAVLRIDRAGIWRSVPLRRGLTVLALLPGLVALASALEWNMLCLMPGLVASGGALLFGVNAWCLDGRGALWRDSLPAAPRLVYLSRVVALVEVLLLAITLTMVMAALRAGVPSPVELAAVVCSALVVTGQVVSGSLRWSVRRPFAVDLRSARATPAPPLVMVGYSSRLAVATTFSGLLFASTTLTGDVWAPVLLAVPMLLVSAYRLYLTSNAWAEPATRARVIATVAS